MVFRLGRRFLLVLTQSSGRVGVLLNEVEGFIVFAPPPRILTTENLFPKNRKYPPPHFLNNGKNLFCFILKKSVILGFLCFSF